MTVVAAEVAPSADQRTVLSVVLLGQDRLTLHSESQMTRQVAILTTAQPVTVHFTTQHFYFISVYQLSTYMH